MSPIRELKTTQAESVGLVWRAARLFSLLVWWSSIPVYWWVNKEVAFYMVLNGSAALSVLTGREYLIHSLQRIRTIVTLRERLLVFGDGEYVLNSIKQDQIWRGETVDPEIDSRLEEYRKRDEQLKESVMKIFEAFVPEAPEDKTSN